MKVGDPIPPHPRHTSGSPIHCFRMPSMLVDCIQSLLSDASWDSMSSYVKLRTPHAEGSRIYGESTCCPPHVSERRQRVNSSCVKLLLRRYVPLNFIQDNTGKTIFRNLDWSQLFHRCAQVTSWFRPPSRRGRGVSLGVMHVHCRQEECPLCLPHPSFSQGNLPFRKYLFKWQNLVNGAYPQSFVHLSICFASW